LAQYEYREFLEVLRTHSYGPIVLFEGEEDFLVDECVDAIVDHTLGPAERSFNLDVIDGGRADVRDVLSHASSFPMMSDKRVVVVRDFDKLISTEDARTAFSAYVNRPLESTVLLLATEKVDGRKKPVPEIKKNWAYVVCRPLWENQLIPWTAARFKSKKRQADGEACELLVSYVGGSLRAIDNEIEKVLVAVGDRTTVSADDIVSVVGATRGFSIFDLQDAIGRKNSADAIRILQRMLEYGESPVYITLMLTRFFMNVMKAGELRANRVGPEEASKTMGVQPRAAKGYMAAAGAYSAAEIEHGLATLLRTDLHLKSSTLEPRVAMELLVLECVAGPRTS